MATRRCQKGSGTVLRRLIDDPLAARRAGWRALVPGLAMIVPGQFTDHLIAGLLTALAWIVAPLIALTIGYGEAFFLQYGRNRQRVVVMVACGILTALTTCVVLSSVGDGGGEVRQWVNVVGSMVLYGGVTIGLSGLVAIGIGRGSGYISGRIDEMSRDDW